MNPKYNVEHLYTNGGDINELKKYCISRTCRRENMNEYMFGKEPCLSFRDGTCMMREYFIEENGIKESKEFVKNGKLFLNNVNMEIEFESL